MLWQWSNSRDINIFLKLSCADLQLNELVSIINKISDVGIPHKETLSEAI